MKKWPLAFFIVVVVFMFFYPYFLNLRPDLDVYVDAGRAVQKGESPYVEDYIYPPIVAYLFSILLKWGELPFKILFCLLTVLALYFTYTMVNSDRKLLLFVGMGAAALNIAAIINFLVLFSFKNKNNFLSSLALSCASVIKIYPFLFIPFHFKKNNFDACCLAGYLLPPLLVLPTLTHQNLSGFFSSVSSTHRDLLFWLVQSIPTFLEYYLGVDLFVVFLALFIFVYLSIMLLLFFFRLPLAKGLGILWILYAFLFPYSEAIHMHVLLVPLMFGLEEYRNVETYSVLQIVGFGVAVVAYLYEKDFAIYIFHAFIAASLFFLFLILRHEVLEQKKR